MSSFIGIGFVFGKTDSTIESFSKFLSFITREGNIKKIAYSTDIDGSNWIEDTSLKKCPIGNISSIMIDNYFGNITINAPIFDVKDIDFNVSMSVLAQGDFGFLLEIDIDQLFKVGDKPALEDFTGKIIELCKNIFSEVSYQYSFCDHEVGIEYSWNEFETISEDVYSVVVVPAKEAFIVKLASWEIDGLTSR